MKVKANIWDAGGSSASLVWLDLPAVPVVGQLVYFNGETATIVSNVRWTRDYHGVDAGQVSRDEWYAHIHCKPE